MGMRRGSSSNNTNQLQQKGSLVPSQADTLAMMDKMRNDNSITPKKKKSLKTTKKKDFGRSGTSDRVIQQKAPIKNQFTGISIQEVENEDEEDPAKTGGGGVMAARTANLYQRHVQSNLEYRLSGSSAANGMIGNRVAGGGQATGDSSLNEQTVF